MIKFARICFLFFYHVLWPNIIIKIAKILELWQLYYTYTLLSILKDIVIKNLQLAKAYVCYTNGEYLSNENIV